MRKTKPAPRLPHRPSVSLPAGPHSGLDLPFPVDKAEAALPGAEPELEEVEQNGEPGDVGNGENGFQPSGEELTLVEEPLELDRAELAAELSEDPVRLYLREIGQVKLLDAASEFRLAAMIEARRLALVTRRRQRFGKQMPEQPETALFHSLLGDLITAWTRLGEDAARLEVEMLDPALILAEAQSLHQSWQTKIPSYIHTCMERELWGKDPRWDSLVTHAYLVFVICYLLPEE